MLESVVDTLGDLIERAIDSAVADDAKEFDILDTLSHLRPVLTDDQFKELTLQFDICPFHVCDIEICADDETGCIELLGLDDDDEENW